MSRKLHDLVLQIQRDMERRLHEDFDRIFADDKRERELSDPRIIEDFLDEEYGGER